MKASTKKEKFPDSIRKMMVLCSHLSIVDTSCAVTCQAFTKIGVNKDKFRAVNPITAIPQVYNPSYCAC